MFISNIQEPKIEQQQKREEFQSSALWFVIMFVFWWEGGGEEAQQFNLWINAAESDKISLLKRVVNIFPSPILFPFYTSTYWYVMINPVDRCITLRWKIYVQNFLVPPISWDFIFRLWNENHILSLTLQSICKMKTEKYFAFNIKPYETDEIWYGPTQWFSLFAYNISNFLTKHGSTIIRTSLQSNRSTFVAYTLSCKWFLEYLINNSCMMPFKSITCWRITPSPLSLRIFHIEYESRKKMKTKRTKAIKCTVDFWSDPRMTA